MRKFETADECIKRRKKVEAVLGYIGLLIIVIWVGLITAGVVTGNGGFFEPLFVFWIPTLIHVIIYVDYTSGRRNLRWLRKIGCEHITDDMQLDYPLSQNTHIYFGKKAVFTTKGGITVPYDQIAWAYAYRRSVNGIVTANALILCTKSGKKIALYEKARTKTIDFEVAIANYLMTACPGLIPGYGSAQKKLYKKVVKSYKKQNK